MLTIEIFLNIIEETLYKIVIYIKAHCINREKWAPSVQYDKLMILPGTCILIVMRMFLSVLLKASFIYIYSFISYEPILILTQMHVC